VVIVALALPALLGSVAMGSDVAVLYYNWSLLQKAVDAAVLAGAAYLPSQPSTAQTSARSYGQQNGIQSSDAVAVSVSSDDMSITMTASRSVPYYFARVLGLTSATAAATATAQAEASQTARGLFPTGFDPISPPQTYQEYKFMQGQVGPGNWGALALGGSGADIFRNNLANGYQGSVSIGDLVSTEPGDMSGPTKQGVDARVQAGVSVDPSIPAGQGIGPNTSYNLSDPRVIEVPIVNWVNINGKSQVAVLGFAMTWLEGMDGSGAIKAEFIDQVAAQNTPGPLANPVNPLCAVCNAYYPVLTQ